LAESVEIVPSLSRSRTGRTASIVGGLMVLVSVVGYLREAALAARFGVSSTMDAYFGAIFIPNILYSILIAGTVSPILIRILVQVEFLVRVATVEVRRNVPRNHDHRDRIERCVGNAGHRVRQPGSQVRQADADLARRARVAIGGVGRHLFVPRRDEADATAAERLEKRDVGVPAEAEDHFDAEPFEILGEQVRRDACLLCGRCALGDRLGD